MNDNTIVNHLKKSPLSQHSSSSEVLHMKVRALAPKRETKSLGKKTSLTKKISPTLKASRIFVMYLEGTKVTTSNFSFKKHDI